MHYCNCLFLLYLRSVSNKHEFRTFIRTRPKAADIAEAVASLLLYFNWTKIAYITTTDSEYSLFVSNIKQVLINKKIKILVQKEYDHPYLHSLSRNAFMDIVEETYRISRIYVMVGEYYEPVGLLHNLERRGLLDTGQYFVIGVDKRFYKYNKPHTYLNPWGPSDSQEEVNAFRSYFHITLRGPSEEVHELQQKNIYYLSKPPFNVIQPHFQNDKIPIQPEAGYLYDAVMLYAETVGKILRERLGDYSNGTLVNLLLRRKAYTSSLGYYNRINKYGDAEGNYTVLNMQDKALHPVGMFEMTTGNGSLPKFRFLKVSKEGSDVAKISFLTFIEANRADVFRS